METINWHGASTIIYTHGNNLKTFALTASPNRGTALSMRAALVVASKCVYVYIAKVRCKSLTLKLWRCQMNVNESAARTKEVKYLFIPYRDFEDENGDELSIRDRSYGYPQLVCGKVEYRSGQMYMLSGRPAPSRLHMQSGEVSYYRVDRMGIYIFPEDIA
jgi:hypothetical protein